MNELEYLGLDKLVDRYNMIVGGFVALASMLLGKYWYLFAVYLLTNFVDWVTGWMYAKKAGVSSSKIGLKGIVKKFGYWVIIWVSFMMAKTLYSVVFDLYGKDFKVIMALGWFVLSNLLVNEFRSIVENFVKLGYVVPDILIKGLDIAQNAVNARTDDILDSVSDAVGMFTGNKESADVKDDSSGETDA